MSYCTNCGAEIKPDSKFCSKCGKVVGKKADIEKGQDREFFTEGDNMGTRQDTLSHATTYWMARMGSPKKDPFVLYTFNTEKDTREALLELPCVHVAGDSQKLICTEVLIFGYYPTENGKYEAIVCGDELTHELWEQAKTSFSEHGGRRKNDLEPERRVAPSPKAKVVQPGKVVFVREDRQQGKFGATLIYRIYKGPDAISAQAFLKQNPVTRQFYYLVVETPEGNYCRDIQGMYKG